MAARAPVILILGAGPNIGQTTARLFADKGYKVALAARSVNNSDDEGQLNIQADFSKTDDVINVFRRVKESLGIPSVVVYNGMILIKVSNLTNSTVSAVTFTPADDPFAVSLDDFDRNTTINVHSAFVAAQQAVQGFAELPDSAARTFIYTGNVLNVSILPKFITQGVGKSGAAHMIWAASTAYKDRGYK